MTLKETLKQIRLKCLSCCCDQAEEVKYCTIKSCPLYELRSGKNPSPKRKGNKNGIEAIVKYKDNINQ